MNRLFTALAVAALFAGCVTVKDELDIRPEETGDGVPTAVEWQNANDTDLAAATTDLRLAEHVASPAAADALLAKIGSAYRGDPATLTVIACVTQYVMVRKDDASRKLWVAALERTAAKSKDDYVKTFCRQQLRLCQFR